MNHPNSDEINKRIAYLLELFRSRIEERMFDNFEKMLTVESTTERKMLLASTATLQGLLGDVERVFAARGEE